MRCKGCVVCKLDSAPAVSTNEACDLLTVVNVSAGGPDKSVPGLYRLDLTPDDARRFARYIYLYFCLKCRFSAHFHQLDRPLIEVIHKRLICNAYLLDNIHLIRINGR